LEATIDSLEALGQEGAVVMLADTYAELNQAIFVAGATVCMARQKYWSFGFAQVIIVDLLVIGSVIGGYFGLVTILGLTGYL